MKTRKYKRKYKKNTNKKLKKHYSKKRIKKKYHGGLNELNGMLNYTFGTFDEMIKALNELVITNNKEGERTKYEHDRFYENSILVSVLNNINDLDNITQILKPLLHLEIKPSNLIEVLKHYLNIEKNDDKTLTEILKDIGTVENLLDFINITRPIPVKDKNYGWYLTSKLINILFDNIDVFPITDYYNVKSNFIICGLLDHILDLNRGRGYSVSEFYTDIFGINNENPMVDDNLDALHDIKMIKDFFIRDNNPNGILPPIVLLVLSCRINPGINFLMNRNSSDPTNIMNGHRKKIMSIMNILKFCCKTCCGSTCGNCDDKKTKATFDSVDIPIDAISGFIKFFEGKNIEQKSCSDLCGIITWDTFEPFFKIFTNVKKFYIGRDWFQKFLFDTIIPYSTFIPLNINAYFNEVVYKEKDILFDEKINFYEGRLLYEYKNDSNYTNPLCFPKETMVKIHKEWKLEKGRMGVEYKTRQKTERKVAAELTKKSTTKQNFFSRFTSRKSKTDNVDSGSKERYYTPEKTDRSSEEKLSPNRFYTPEDKRSDERFHSLEK
jgi:hypothetical protein